MYSLQLIQGRMSFIKNLLLPLVILLSWNTRFTVSKAEGTSEGDVEKMGLLMGQVMEQDLNLNGCDFVLVTNAPHSPLFSSIHR